MPISPGMGAYHPAWICSSGGDSDEFSMTRISERRLLNDALRWAWLAFFRSVAMERGLHHQRSLKDAASMGYRYAARRPPPASNCHHARRRMTTYTDLTTCIIWAVTVSWRRTCGGRRLCLPFPILITRVYGIGGEIWLALAGKRHQSKAWMTRQRRDAGGSGSVAAAIPKDIPCPIASRVGGRTVIRIRSPFCSKI